MMNSSWLICPVCGGKTRDQIRKDTVLINYPLYCPKCKQTTLINVNELNTTVLKEITTDFYFPEFLFGDFFYVFYIFGKCIYMVKLLYNSAKYGTIIKKVKYFCILLI